MRRVACLGCGVRAQGTRAVRGAVARRVGDVILFLTPTPLASRLSLRVTLSQLPLCNWTLDSTSTHPRTQRPKNLSSSSETAPRGMLLPSQFVRKEAVVRKQPGYTRLKRSEPRTPTLLPRSARSETCIPGRQVYRNMCVKPPRIATMAMLGKRNSPQGCSLSHSFPLSLSLYISFFFFVISYFFLSFPRTICTRVSVYLSVCKCSPRRGRPEVHFPPESRL